MLLCNQSRCRRWLGGGGLASWLRCRNVVASSIRASASVVVTSFSVTCMDMPTMKFGKKTRVWFQVCHAKKKCVWFQVCHAKKKNMCLVSSLPRQKKKNVLGAWFQIPSLPRKKQLHVFGSKFAMQKKYPYVLFQVCHGKKKIVINQSIISH